MIKSEQAIARLEQTAQKNVKKALIKTVSLYREAVRLAIRDAQKCAELGGYIRRGEITAPELDAIIDEFADEARVNLKKENQEE